MGLITMGLTQRCCSLQVVSRLGLDSLSPFRPQERIIE